MDRYIRRNKPHHEAGQSDPAEHRASKKPRLGNDQRDDEGANESLNVSPTSDSWDDEPTVLGVYASAEEVIDEPPVTVATAFESSLPTVATGTDTNDEYEMLRVSQAAQDDEVPSKHDGNRWTKGRSSIYVDAFNLALDTVLNEESHLFDDKEKHVFEQWRSIGYEAQYMYVRLFLRKTASWHRINRLSYHNDISDMSLAISTLLERRAFPLAGLSLQPDIDSEIELQEWSLGDSFTFADDSDSYIQTVEEAAALLSMDELKILAKEARVQGKNKGDLLKAFCRASAQQTGLLALGIKQFGANDSSSDGVTMMDHRNRNAHFLQKILSITGPLIRLSAPVFKLFERVHLVFFRSTEWTEKSLTTILLAKMAKRNYPEYIVCRSTNIFPSRRHLLDFELSMRKDFEVDQALESRGSGEEGFRKVIYIFESIASRWRELIREENYRENHVYEFGEGGYLRRFSPGHAYTRIAHKAAHALGRLHKYWEEHQLLTELLNQRLFHLARRGAWYQRKALLEERYMWETDPDPVSPDPEVRKKHWQRIAVTTCETALEDRDCHLIYHYDLQKRLLKLEKKLRIPRRLQHDFGHVRLHEPEIHVVYGIQLVRREPDIKDKPIRTSGKTMWLDELGAPDKNGNPLHVRVEEMCLSHYRSKGWKGYHSEGGILRTLFAYLFFDIMFVYVPNVFQTACQTCPLDLFTDTFYTTRASQINHRLVEISNGEGPRIVREVHSREYKRRTCVIGLNWDFDIDDLVELVSCFDGEALAAVCKVIAQEYRSRVSGVPDLILWRPATDGSPKTGEVMFAEVKSANDRLSDAQRLWINVLIGAGIRVALCNAVATEVHTVK